MSDPKEMIAEAREALEAVTAERDSLAAVIERVRAFADKAEHGALRWADPLPVPEWVDHVRQILDTAPTASLAREEARNA